MLTADSKEKIKNKIVEFVKFHSEEAAIYIKELIEKDIKEHIERDKIHHRYKV